MAYIIQRSYITGTSGGWFSLRSLVTPTNSTLAAPVGLEPTTSRLTVWRSTDWATGQYLLIYFASLRITGPAYDITEPTEESRFYSVLLTCHFGMGIPRFHESMARPGYFSFASAVVLLVPPKVYEILPFCIRSGFTNPDDVESNHTNEWSRKHSYQYGTPTRPHIIHM